MEKLSSSWCKVETVPESYVLPPEIRPGKLVFPMCNSIPVIDLAGLGFDRNEVIQHILKASQEYGFFQLANYGVSEEQMQDVLKVAKEFFDLPAEDKAGFYSDVGKSIDECRLTHSLTYGTEQIHYWRDYFRHPCHPLEKYLELWPQNPSRYRYMHVISLVDTQCNKNFGCFGL
ncbi:Flavanone 3-dioxygenase [Bertholletia excelsa]